MSVIHSKQVSHFVEITNGAVGMKHPVALSTNVHYMYEFHFTEIGNLFVSILR
jgi:hypothetical protein